MDAVAVEVEQVGEGQRSVAPVLGAERAAEPLAVRAREGDQVPRSLSPSTLHLLSPPLPPSPSGPWLSMPSFRWRRSWSGR